MQQKHLVRSVLATTIAASCASQSAHAETFETIQVPEQYTAEQFFVSDNISETVQRQQFMIILKGDPVGSFEDLDQKSTAQRLQALDAVQQNIQSKINRIDPHAKVIASTKVLTNSLIIEANEKTLKSILQSSEVVAIHPIMPEELFVKESSKYIQADTVKADRGLKGANIKVAVLDSGIDYTHKVFDGAGTKEAYKAAIADKTDAPGFPIGQVQDGYDYIGDVPGKTTKDPDPIDLSGHGTHVAHDVTGIAPEVELYAYRVCNASGCSSAAYIPAIERSMDLTPDDPSTNEHMNVINMSLGGGYGLYADKTEEVIKQAAKKGINTVIAAGNSQNVPFIVGGPSTVPYALSVAAMTHPTGTATDNLTETLLGEKIQMLPASFNPTNQFKISDTDAPLVIPSANQTACEPFADDVDFTGKTVLLDRGACAFVDKVRRAQEKGAAFVIVANNQEKPKVISMSGSGTDDIKIHAIMISNEDANELRKAAWKAEPLTFSFEWRQYDTVGSASTFTSRGPAIQGHLKPEIAAPGTSIVAAAVGTGDKEQPKSGTSMAAPIVAGAMSLLREQYPHRSALELKAVVMNTANLDVKAEPEGKDPKAELAPISLIGSGLIQIEKAIASDIAAWDSFTEQAAISLGHLPLDSKQSFKRKVTVKNYSDSDKVYQIQHRHRFENDKDRLTVQFSQAEITVPAKDTAEFEVTLTIDPTKLPAWKLDSFSNAWQTDGKYQHHQHLTNSELDGSIQLIEKGETEEAIHLVYHALPQPKKTLSVQSLTTVADKAEFKLNNDGFSKATFTPFTLLESDAQEPHLKHDIRAVAFNLGMNESICEGLQLQATFLMDKPVLHPHLGSFAVDLDINRDGVFDYTVRSHTYGFKPHHQRVAVPISASHQYGKPKNSSISILEHETGNNTLTLNQCLKKVGLSISDMNKSIDLRYRVENSPFQYGAGFDSQVDTVLTRTKISPPKGHVKTTSIAGILEGRQTRTLDSKEEMTFEITGAPYGILLSSDGLSSQAIPFKDSLIKPAIKRLQIFTVKESATAGTKFGKVVLSHPLDDVVFSLVEAHEGIAMNTSGELFIQGDGLDFDKTQSHDLKVIATLHGNQSTEVMIKVQVENEGDEVPVFDKKTTFDVAEAIYGAGHVVGQLTAKASEPHASIKSFRMPPSDLFHLSESGELTLKSRLDFEKAAEHKLEVTVTDSLDLNATQTITVNVLDQDEAPTLELPTRVTISESAKVGHSIATAKANSTLADSSEVTYEIAPATFAIDEKGLITLKQTASVGDHRVTVTVKDSESNQTDQDFVVSVDAVVFDDPTLSSKTTFLIKEAVVGANTTIGQLTATPSIRDATVEFTMDEHPLFALTTEGTLSLKARLDYEKAQEHILKVQMKDSHGQTGQQEVTIMVNDMDERPTIKVASFLTLTASAIAGSKVSKVEAISKLAGAPAVTLSVDANDAVDMDDAGNLTVKKGLKEGSYQIKVTAKDADGNLSTKTIVLQVQSTKTDSGSDDKPVTGTPKTDDGDKPSTDADKPNSSMAKPTQNKDSSGSMFWLLLGLLGISQVRRK